MDNLLEQLMIKPQPKQKPNITIKFDDSSQVNTDVDDFNHSAFIKKLESMKKVIVRNETVHSGKERDENESTTQTINPLIVQETVRDRLNKTPKVLDTNIVRRSINEIKNINIEGDVLHERLPPTDPIAIPRNPFFMSNREIFTKYVNQLFSNYRDDVINDKTNISCDKNKGEFKLLTHQKLVRDYINDYSPYRGLLLYHGLGSGKTCTSISIAENIIYAASIATSESLLSNRKIVVMTPASLRTNYIEELKKCGNPIYQKNQYWEFISIVDNDSHTETLSAALHLSVDYIKKKRGAWLVNVKKETNYENLNAEDKKSLDEQLNEMIHNKFSFINYNGLRKNKINQLSKNNTVNPFDDKVVIIDEAHNFVSMIVNKIEKEKRQDNPQHVSTMLYKFLMEAQNAKVVLLTGTPIINYPNEIGILFNLLRGYIKTWYFPVKPSPNTNEKFIRNMFAKIKTMDYMTFENNLVTITRNPHGFVNITEDGIYKGVKLDTKGDFMNDNEYVKFIKSLFQKNDIVLDGRMKINYEKALPDKLLDFTNLFIQSDNGEMKNVDLFKRRILGLTSYFRSAQENLMPAYDEETDLHVFHIPMSDYQFQKYEDARVEERKQEVKRGRSKKNELFEDTSSTYRIFSRAFCNFVFPDSPKRPMPNNNKDFVANVEGIADEDALDAISASERLENIDGRTEIEIEDENDNDTQNYQIRIRNALNELKQGSTTFLTPEGLQTYSPKFLELLKILENDENKGSHLIYSQFRTLEGIGILGLVLEANGYYPLKLKKNSQQQWTLDIPKVNTKFRMFALYTGTETTEEKEIIRNIFNSDWEYLPIQLARQLKEIHGNNYMGEIIRIFMITASGAEGISLKNTRYVHIIEPYWHPVRIEQVVGRARRICSHESLDKSLRNIKVFLYLMTFTDEQIKNGSISLLKKDKSKYDKTSQRPITSDESLYEITRRKEAINKQLLTSVKESAFDCSIFTTRNTKEVLECYSFGNSKNTSTFAFKPSIQNEEKSERIVQKNKKSVEWKGKKIVLDGKPYVIRLNEEGKPTNQVYDYDAYMQALNNPNINIPLRGKLAKKDGKHFLNTNN
jgi:hypothetical protein